MSEEYQILENGHPDSVKGMDDNRKAASLYDLIPAHADSILKGPGEWNIGMIVSKGAHVEHWLNGVKVVEYERGSARAEFSVVSERCPWNIPSFRMAVQTRPLKTLADSSVRCVQQVKWSFRELRRLAKGHH